MSISDHLSILTDDERSVLQKICDDVGVPSEIVARMIAAENHVYGMGRRHGIWEALELLITEGLNAEGHKQEMKQ